ncbi:MAG: S41 family peptidase [Bacteroidia bacterium]|nr:S41 family peptidase [Bacteroidia bacterium]
MSRFIRYTVLGLTLVMVGLLAGFQIKGRFGSAAPLTLDQSLRKFQQALRFVEQNYVEEPSEAKLVEDAIRGMMKGLDPHSFYIPASDMQGMQEEMEGSFEGIGIQFNILDDTIYVEHPLPGGPSEKLGILTGDRIVKVEDSVVAGIGITNAQVTRLLKGPSNTQVRVSILRRGTPGLLEFNITRGKIPINSVDYAYMIAPEVGYIRVTRFAETTYDEFKEQLSRLQEAGMQTLVLDLRGNPGGYMTMAYKMADEFLTAGKLIVSTDGRIAQSRQEYRSTSSIGSFEEGAVIVLLDYGSASASEIVAGALQDHDRGLLIGVRSFGKGLVQIQEEFEDGSALRLVISKYYTPSGRCIQKPYQVDDEEYEREIADRFQSGEVFDPSKTTFPDSLKYSTAGGRTVYGGGGIFPDIFVPNDTSGGSKYLTDLTINDLFRRFSLDYADRHAELLQRYPSASAFISGFSADAGILRAFTDYAAAHGVPYSAAGLEASRRHIENRIKAFLGRRLYNDEAFYPVLHQNDPVIQEALRQVPTARRVAAGDFSALKP